MISILLIVPTAFWVRLRLPSARPYVEFITLLPFVIPPIILVFGCCAVRPPAAGPRRQRQGLDFLLVAAYVILSFPYMYRAVDAGLRRIDVRTLTEAAQSMGAGWTRILWAVILPNLRVALLSGAFLTLAIVIGEYTIASFIVRPAFGPYLSLLGRDKAFEPAAVSIISFGLTWLAMGVIALLGRGSRQSRPGRRGALGDEADELPRADRRPQALRRDRRRRGLQPRRGGGRVREVSRTSGCGKTTTLRMIAGFETPTPARSRSRARTSRTGPRTAATSGWSSSRTRSSRT